MPGRVVDASVLAAWGFREPRADEALALIDGMDLYAPALLRFELTSVAHRKILSDPGLVAPVKASLATVLTLPIRWTDIDHVAALNLAIGSGLSAYDASYLYLARALGLPLLTFDARLSRAAVSTS